VTDIKLSICIPTYNRSRFLDRALASIASQDRDDLEVVVSDNCSPDDTSRLMAERKKDFAHLVYVRLPENRGFDANLRSCVEAASGRHCWTLGDDDWIEPGAIARVIEVLDQHPDIPGLTMLCNAYTVDEELAVPAPCTGAVEVLRGQAEIMAHRNMGYLFGNLSINVFHREKALEVIRSGRLIPNTCSGHHLQTALVARHQSWIFLDLAGSAWRYGNDSAMANGLYRRAKLAFTAYPEIVAEVFGVGSEVHRQFMSEQELLLAKQYVIRAKNHPQYNRFLSPYQCGAVERWRINLEALRALYPYPKFWTQVAPLFLVPGPALPLSAKIRSLVRRVAGSEAA
jgi:abequosyltransferase